MDDATFLTTQLEILFFFLRCLFVDEHDIKFLIAVLELMFDIKSPQHLQWFYCSNSSKTSLSKYSTVSKSPAFKTFLGIIKDFMYMRMSELWVFADLQQRESTCLWCTSGESQSSVRGFESVFAEREEESAASPETWRQDRCRHTWCRFGGDSQMATRQDARDAGWLQACSCNSNTCTCAYECTQKYTEFHAHTHTC